MANPLPDEKELYKRIRLDNIIINKEMWDFIYHRVNDNITAIVFVCQRWIANQEAMPVQEAGRILGWTKEIRNVISSITIPSKDNAVFPQFQDGIPLNDVVQELITHQFGNDIYAIELILQDAIDPVNAAPVPWEVVRKIMVHARAMGDFLEKFRDSIQWKDSEEKYRTLYDSFLDGLIMTDMEGHILEVNQAYLKMLNYTQEEMTKLSYQHFTPEKWRESDEKFVNTIMSKEGVSVEYEKENIRKDGTVFPVNLKAWVIKDKENNPLGMWRIVRDITERKRAESELEAEVFASHAVIDHINAGLSLSDKNGHCEIFNHGMQEITGYTMEEINKYDFGILLYPDPEDRQKAISRLNEIVTGKVGTAVETKIRAKDGAEKIVSVLTSLIHHKGGDMFLSVWRDITVRRRAEDALKASETRFRRLFETAQDGILILNGDTGRISEVNQFLIRMLGYSREEFLGKELWEVGAFMDKEKSKAAFHELQVNGYVRYEDLPLQAKDGSLINVEFVSNVYSVDAARIIQCNIRDITDRRRLEVAREESNKKFEQLALKDSHTGLYNHRYLEDALTINFTWAERQAGQLSVIMMDLDYFKSINDVYGHVFGDIVLKQFADLLTKTVRPYDIVIRYGGEEFIIISPDTGRDGALILANRILNTMQMHTFGNKAHSIKLKLSLAVATYPDDNVLTGMELVDLADQILNKAKESGGNRVFSSVNVKSTAAFVPLAPDINLLKEKIARLTKRANQSLIEETLAFAKALESKDHYTGDHGEKTVHYAVRIARGLNFTDDQIELIKQAAMLHDLGKVGISEQILRKKSKLNKKEFDEIKRHPQIGADIIRPIHSLHPVIPALLYHHERWDGKGYPHGLRKQQIPLAARIITVADVYQSLVSDRPYRPAYSQAKAVTIIKESSGTQFDPAIVKSFLKILRDERHPAM
jgi:diguanylate cyclase (GGDEF)-like protein/PAS domain S-box-containing protein